MIQVNPTYVPREKVRVLVSGGVDSIAAAHWLATHYRLDFEVVHFHHNIQPSNTEMYKKVWAFSTVAIKKHILNKHRSPFYYPAFSDTSESGLRNWRMWEMEGIGGNFITAHHLDDCVESYLMNTFKGVPEHMPIPWDTFTGRGFHIYHPFLRTTKDDFIQYAQANNLMEYVVEDPTNKDNGPRRNWIRNVLVPEINNKELGLQTVVRKKFYL